MIGGLAHSEEAKAYPKTLSIPMYQILPGLFGVIRITGIHSSLYLVEQLREKLHWRELIHQGIHRRLSLYLVTNLFSFLQIWRT